LEQALLKPAIEVLLAFLAKLEVMTIAVPLVDFVLGPVASILVISLIFPLFSYIATNCSCCC